MSSLKLPSQGRRVTFIGKGGSTKTHTLAHVRGHWARMGYPTGAVDSDRPGEDEDGSLYTWDLMAKGLVKDRPVKAQYNALHLPGTIVEETPADGILGIDTGAWSNTPGGTHHSALAMSDLAVLCLQPAEGELHRSASVWAALKYLNDTTGRRPELVVLLTRTHHTAKANDEARRAMENRGIEVLQSTVPNQQGEGGYSRTFGKELVLADDDPMHKVAVEILTKVAIQ
ncbi:MULTISPECIES: hypothetical protein [unclassified Streptomyces]|uniref:hypothetical protein n=1 Tax=unclassified Streptomyces TaxID=2593676 RepID=UPI0035DF248D